MLLKERQILCYGNDSYGGMSGRDLMAAAAGLYQVTNQSYLGGRITQVQQFAQKLQANGIAVLSPPGGHAVYLDMDAFFFGCNRKPEDFASVGFTLQLIKDYGIRAAEAGPFGWAYDLKKPDDPERAKIPNLVRFAVPRHVYSDEHINYTVAAIKELYDRKVGIYRRPKEHRRLGLATGLARFRLGSDSHGRACSVRLDTHLRVPLGPSQEARRLGKAHSLGHQGGADRPRE